MGKKKERIAIAEMLLCSVLWSIAGILFKLLDWNPVVITGYRSLFSALTMAGLMLCLKQKVVFNKHSISIALSLVVTFFCFVFSNKLTTAANAIVIQFISPVFILLYDVLFRHKRCSWKDATAVGFTLGGIALFALDGLESGHTLGNFVALCSGLGMAAMYICVDQSRGSEKNSGLLLAHSVTALIGIPFAFIFPTSFDIKSVTVIVVLGVVQLGIPYILLALASDNCPPLACSLLSAVEPLLSPVWVAIFAHEYPSYLALIGGVIVIGTVTVWCIFKDKKEKS